MDSMEMRRNAIVQLINEKETVTFAQLKEEFPDVSEMTLRTAEGTALRASQVSWNWPVYKR